MTPTEQAIVLAAGFVAGILTSSVGVASLVSFPTLVALGIPPVVANASNTIGLIPAGLSGSFGYRRELAAYPRVTGTVLATCAIGAVAGAALLLGLDPSVFEAVVPWLILLACLLVGIQPWLSRWLRRQHDATHAALSAQPQGRTRMSPVTTFFAALTGVYGGYFGAGSGVMMVAVLALGLDIDLRIVNGLKTLAVLAGNLVAGAIFVVVAPLHWPAIALLAAGSLGGGYVGARIGRRLHPTLLRVLIVIAGLAAAAFLA